MSYRQHLDELNDLINSQFEQEGTVDVEPIFVQGQKKDVTLVPGNTYNIIQIAVSSVHGSGITYVQDWSFENGIRTTQRIQEAKIYSEEQAKHIIANESGRSSMVRVNAKFDIIAVNYGASIPTKSSGMDRAWSHWMDAPEFDLELFEDAMSNTANFEAHRTSVLTEPNQVFIVSHLTNTQLKVVVSFEGHISDEDYQTLRNSNKFGFNDVKIEHVGEGAASFTVFTFTL